MKQFKIKNCRYCEKEYTPTMPSHLYCSDDCAYNGVIQRHYKKSFQDNTALLESAIKYLEGATTISKESTYKCTEAHDTEG